MRGIFYLRGEATEIHMLNIRFLSLAGAVALGVFMAAPASALTMKECGAKYNAAKDAGTLGGLTWNQFRKNQCGSDASATPEPAKPAKKAATEKKPAKASDKAAAPPAGLSMKECSAKYQAAKDAGTLGGLKWNDFRKASCGAGAADDESVPAPTEAQYTSEPDKPTTAAPRGMKFPRSVSAKYSSETPGKARMHTCLEQYYALKDANALGGLKWIQKGGGYYSLCNDRLKG